jgi:CHASE2 domain-containing sensor protein
MRNLNTIAAEIQTLWKQKPPPPFARSHATPYLEAMEELKTVKDLYGLETGDDIVMRFLVNSAGWSGADARRIKAELNDHLKG